VADEDLADLPQELRTWQRLRSLSIGYAVLSVVALVVSRAKAPTAHVQSALLVAGSVLCLGLSAALLVLTTRMQRRLAARLTLLEDEAAGQAPLGAGAGGPGAVRRGRRGPRRPLRG
jgi:hypothetical protein